MQFHDFQFNYKYAKCLFECKYIFGPDPDLAVDEEVDAAVTGQEDGHGWTHVQAQQHPGV